MSKLEKNLIVIWWVSFITVIGLLVGLYIISGDHFKDQAIVDEVVAVPNLGSATETIQQSEAIDVGQGANLSTSPSEPESDSSAEGELQSPESLTTLDPALEAMLETVSSTAGCYHGETLTEVINNLRHEQYEVIVAFTSTGQKLFEQTNWNADHASLSPTQDWLLRTLNGEIIVHNHPHVDAPFSSDDLKFLGSYNAGQGVVVSANYIYTLTPHTIWGQPESMYETSLSVGYLAPAYHQVKVLADGTEAYYATDALMYYIANLYDLDYSKTPFSD